jgi:lysophospholipase L1-like esterase
MLSRRNFLKSSAVAAGVTSFCATADTQAQEYRANPSGVGGYNYRLPKFERGSRLLFQGDSITHMSRGRNEKDRNHYLGHSYVYLIASRLGVDMPEAQFDVYNRGESSHALVDLRKRWQEDAIDMNPDLLSILIGVNDVGRRPDGVDVESWEADYRFMLDASRKANPELRLVLLDPFVLQSGRLADVDTYKKWRDQAKRLGSVVGQLTKDYDAVQIKTQDVFDVATKTVSPEHWIWDGIHPLPQGHELIARNWLQEISARWS